MLENTVTATAKVIGDLTEKRIKMLENTDTATAKVIGDLTESLSKHAPELLNQIATKGFIDNVTGLSILIIVMIIFSILFVMFYRRGKEADWKADWDGLISVVSAIVFCICAILLPLAISGIVSIIYAPQAYAFKEILCIIRNNS